DHVLLVALHAANTEFGHAPASRDLALLLESGVDHRALIDRAGRWRLGTAMFIALSALRNVGSTDVPDKLVNAFDPGRVRLAILRTFYRPGELPVTRADF